MLQANHTSAAASDRASRTHAAATPPRTEAPWLTCPSSELFRLAKHDDGVAEQEAEIVADDRPSAAGGQSRHRRPGVPRPPDLIVGHRVERVRHSACLPECRAPRSAAGAETRSAPGTPTGRAG